LAWPGGLFDAPEQPRSAVNIQAHGDRKTSNKWRTGCQYDDPTGLQGFTLLALRRLCYDSRGSGLVIAFVAVLVIVAQS